MSLLKNLKKSLIIPAGVAGLVGITLAGCNQKMVESEQLFEYAKVIRMEHSDSYSVPEVGFDFDGDLTLHNVDYPEKNIIEFDGKVDFEVNNKEIYNRFKEGDSARVCYKATYWVTFEDLDKDGKKEETNREISGYRFLDAKKEQQSVK
jgi:hypothetical protein